MNNVYVIDLDGTLLKKETLSHEDKNLLFDIKKNNEVIIATGRKMFEAQEILDDLDFEKNNKVILCDGQYCMDYADKSVKQMDFLNSNDICSIFDELKDFLLEMRVISTKKDYVVYGSRFSIEYIRNKRKILSEVAEPFFISSDKDKKFDVEKIVLWTKSNLSEEKINHLKECYEFHNVGKANRWEIKKKGVNKATTLCYLIEKYGYDEKKIYVFGNDENDLPLFEQFKNSFVMSNAKDELKNKAKYVIDDVIECIVNIEEKQNEN